MRLLWTDIYGRPMGFVNGADIDFEVGAGAANDFQVEFSRRDWSGAISYGCRLYAPGTEFGGIVTEISTSTQKDSIFVKGYTWRGMLDKKIIEPPAGADYATAIGDIHTIIRGYISAFGLADVFVCDAPAGVSANYRFDRYCTAHDGFAKMLRSVGRRLEFQYIDPEVVGNAGYVRLTTVPIVDYTERVELSADVGINFSMTDSRRGVNHLICLGKGELKDRTVIHLYIDRNNQISTTQYYTGVDEITAVYDSSGSEVADLKSGGEKKLLETRNRKEYDMQLDRLDLNVGIGDIIGGRDYLTGAVLQKPIARKIWTVSGGREKIEYKLEGDT